MTSYRCALAAAVIVVVGAVVAASGPQQRDDDLSSPKLRIEWEEFKKLYDAKSIEVVDVRGSDAFKLGRIPGARSIPENQVAKRADDLKKLKKEIITYCACQGDHTSARAALTLQKKGIQSRALVGGYHKWLQVEGRAER